MTLQKAEEYYIEYMRSYCLSSTFTDILHTLNLFKRFVNVFFGVNADLVELDFFTPQVLLFFQTYLRTSKVYDDRPDAEHFSASGRSQMTRAAGTVNSYMIKVNRFFRYLYTAGFMSEDITCLYHSVPAPVKQKMPLFKHEVDELFASVETDDENSVRERLILSLGLYCGLRRCEMVDLKISNIDFGNKMIYIANSKMNRSRYVYLADCAAAVMKKYIERFRSKKESEFDNLLFSMFGNKPMTSNSLENVCGRRKERSGIDRLTLHMLRHTFASAFLISGGDLFTLSQILGHSFSITTVNYVKETYNYRMFAGDDVFSLPTEFMARFYTKF